jgi:hypothetical protein
MSEPASFHVRHDLQPELTRELLLLLSKLPEGQTQAQLRTAAQARGYKLSERKDYNKLLRSLAELKLLTSAHEPLTLSNTGRIAATVADFYPHLLPDFVHFLYYALWDTAPSMYFSWSYRTVCDILWQTAPGTVNRSYLVSLVLQEAEQRFCVQGISFSASSVAGILNWLAALNPLCLTTQDRQQIFNRRSYCSVELFALTLNHIYQINRGGDSFIPLSPSLRQNICRLCLISLEAFDEMLDQAETHFSKLQIRRERGERFSMLDFSWADIAEQELHL